MVLSTEGAASIDENEKITDICISRIASEKDLKSNLVNLLREQIRRLNLTQAKAANIIGIDQSDLSKLIRGQTEGFALARVLAFVRAMGGDVEINVTTGPALGEGRLRFRAALEAA